MGPRDDWGWNQMNGPERRRLQPGFRAVTFPPRCAASRLTRADPSNCMQINSSVGQRALLLPQTSGILIDSSPYARECERKVSLCSRSSSGIINSLQIAPPSHLPLRTPICAKGKGRRKKKKRKNPSYLPSKVCVILQWAGIFYICLVSTKWAFTSERTISLKPRSDDLFPARGRPYIFQLWITY